MREDIIVKKKIALLSSCGLRRGPDSPLIRFVQEFDPLLKASELWIPESVKEAIFACGLLRDHPELKTVKAGREGGIVKLTYMVVEDVLDVIIFLLDSSGPASIYPEIRALRRECVAKQKFFLSTYASAREWASLMWSNPGNYMLSAKKAETFAEPLTRQTIALIAHDAMKEDMIKFAHEHKILLEKFSRRIGTGTTATLLSGNCQKIDELIKKEDVKINSVSEEKKEELIRRLNELKRLRELVVKELKLKLKMDPKDSGPKGGDVQVANEVLDGKCQKVIFFEDPFTFPPHDADIQLLERTCRLCGDEVLCLSDPVSANKWAETWKSNGKSDSYLDYAPVTLMSALEKHLKKLAGNSMRVVLCPTGQDEKDTIHNIICRAAAWYLNALIVKMGTDKMERNDLEGRELRLVIPWGTVMGSLVEELEKVRSRGQENLRKVPNLIAMPMVGLMSSVNPALESNRLAEKLAGLFNAKSDSIPTAAFVDKRADLSGFEVTRKVIEQFSKVDIALLHGKPLPHDIRYFGTVTRAPIDPEMIKEVRQRGAICEISGLFLNANGGVVSSRKFQRVGMDYEHLRQMGNNPNRRSIFLIGSPDEDTEDYIKMAKAIFRAQFPSVLITDVNFARRLLDLR